MSINGVQVMASDMAVLQGSGWSTDSILNAYTSLLKESAECKRRSAVVLQSYCLLNLRSGQRNIYNFNNVGRWTRRTCVLDSSAIIIPLHWILHWTVAVVNPPAAIIRMYNSLLAVSDLSAGDLSGWLHDVECQWGRPLTEWSIVKKRCWCQPNIYDCGMLVCFVDA